MAAIPQSLEKLRLSGAVKRDPKRNDGRRDARFLLLHSAVRQSIFLLPFQELWFDVRSHAGRQEIRHKNN